MTVIKNLIGERYGYLEVIERSSNTKAGKARWKCVCDCGNETIVASSDLISGHTQSCGCKKYESKNRVHGMTKTDIHKKWSSMLQRCYDKNHKSYLRYGAFGVKVCDEWRNDFISFMNWSYSNGYKESLSLDRIDNSKGYSPDNCRWVEWREQANNRTSNRLISYKGKTQPIKKWCEELGLSYLFIYQRMHRGGLTFEEAITKPIVKYRSHKKETISAD